MGGDGQPSRSVEVSSGMVGGMVVTVDGRWDGRAAGWDMEPAPSFVPGYLGQHCCGAPCLQ